MRNGTEWPLSTPEKVVSVRHRGVSATLSATVDPCGALVPGCGDWRVTIPGFEPGPAAPGTSTGGGPALSVTCTVEPSDTRAPGAGACAIAIPATALSEWR